MCVAIYKPTGAKTPTLETLKKCWDTNPDGAGFARRRTSKDGNYTIEIRKGFMDWQSFEDAYKKFNLADEEGDLLIHFRISTHGGVCKGNTHPFPITADKKLLQSTHILSNFALIHNGVLPITPELEGISDTMELCRKIWAGSFYKKPQALFNLIGDLIGTNKLCMMTSDNVYLAGDWKEVDGVYFSNEHWRWKGMWESRSYGNWQRTETGWTYDPENDYESWSIEKSKKEKEPKDENITDGYDLTEEEKKSYLDMGICPFCGWEINHTGGGKYQCEGCSTEYIKSKGNWRTL